MMKYSTNPCPHCGKSRNTSTAPLITTTTGTATISAMGWHAIEPFLPPTVPATMHITFNVSTMCQCTIDMLDAKLREVTAERDALQAERDALLAEQRENDHQGHQYRLMSAVPLDSAVEVKWGEMQAYLAERIATVFQITFQELGIDIDRKD